MLGESSYEPAQSCLTDQQQKGPADHFKNPIDAFEPNPDDIQKMQDFISQRATRHGSIACLEDITLPRLKWQLDRVKDGPSVSGGFLQAWKDDAWNF